VNFTSNPGSCVNKWALSGFVIVFCLLETPAYAQSTEAGIDAPESIAYGSNGEIYVMLDGQQIGAFELALSSEPAGGLDFISISNGNAPPGFNIVSGLKSAGAAAISGFMSTTPISEQTTIATINFTAKSKRSLSVSVDISGKLYDPEGNEIETRFASKQIQVIGKQNSFTIPLLIGFGVCILALVTIITIRLNHKNRRSVYPDGGVKLEWE
jgi:hypothetical protein